MQQKKTTQEEYQKCVNAVVDYINLHLGEEIDLKSLARISHFSPFYFHRIMKACLGEPVGTFIVRTRTEAAARLLRYSDMPIADIAYRIGYSSPSSLSKVFKQFYGISPLEYRNNKNFVIMKPAIIRPELELKSEIKNVPARNVIYIRLSGDYKLNDYGVSVKKMIADTYPNMTIVVVPELYNATLETSTMFLLADEILGQPTVEFGYADKYYAHEIVRDLSSWKQKVSAGTYGAIVQLPFAIGSMTGI